MQKCTKGEKDLAVVVGAAMAAATRGSKGEITFLYIYRYELYELSI